MSIAENAVADSAAGPYALTTGPDGALWFTLVHSGRIGRLVPGEKPTSHRLEPDSGPTVITPGPDRALWFTEYRADRIGRIATDGVIDEFDVPTPGCGPGPSPRVRGAEDLDDTEDRDGGDHPRGCGKQIQTVRGAVDVRGDGGEDQGRRLTRWPPAGARCAPRMDVG
ncbi:hypothetical protein ACNPQM_32295 [Streptomyces sp. NPDC056231]|uniref:Vgb family protein n=1 Tax=Streptomyces sp. NPDC056231 TaxID=3345755 RepID=UPI003AACFC29